MVASTRRGSQRQSDELRAGRQTVGVFEIYPSPENELLYRARTTDDGDFNRLVKSIGEHGVQSPILVSRDRFIVSGHQRRRASIEAGLSEVPIIVLKCRRADYTDDEWIAILREHNTGREKTFDELVREKIVDIDPDEAVRHIVDDKVQRSTSRIETIELSQSRIRRCEISEAKRPFADAILSIIDELDEYLPVSLRAIHYRLLTLLVLRNCLRPDSTYVNDLASYKDLSDIATRMRLAGEIPFTAIQDDTRPVSEWQCWDDASDFIEDQLKNLFVGYARDLMQSQSLHFEIVTEKLTVKSFVEKIAANYTIPSGIIRGNSGIDTRFRIARRFRRSRKDGLFLFCLGDCDPDGDNIVTSTLRSLRDEFGIDSESVAGVRVAITHEQADRLKLPRTLDAKDTSTNYAKFVERHGRTDCYELDAVQPTVLQDWLDEAIRGVIDIEAYNYEAEQQTAEAVSIAARRKAIVELMKRQEG